MAINCDCATIESPSSVNEPMSSRAVWVGKKLASVRVTPPTISVVDRIAWSSCSVNVGIISLSASCTSGLMVSTPDSTTLSSSKICTLTMLRVATAEAPFTESINTWNDSTDSATLSVRKFTSNLALVAPAGIVIEPFFDT